MAFTNLNRKINTQYPKRKKKGKSMLKFFGTIFLLLLILALAIYFPVRGIYSSLNKMKVSAKALSASAKSENLDDMIVHLNEIKAENSELNSSLNWLAWIRVIPFLGGYYADAKHFSTAAGYELTAVGTVANSLEPNKVELGFTGQPTAGTDRVSQIVKILDKVMPQLDTIQPQLKSAADEVSTIDTSKYPEKFGTHAIRVNIEAAKNLIVGADYAVREARPALEIAPSALGDPTPKNYLIIFQNDKELRATGGFMTAYAFLKLDHGHVSSSGSDDIYHLDEKLLDRCKSIVCPLTPPAAIARYLPESDGKARTAWSMRDSNFSPDVPTSMEEFEKMYSLIPGGEKFDGIILIDTNVVQTLIGITGPIEVDGTTYSDDTDKRCNCPNVIYGLEDYAQIIEKGQSDRKAILGTLMQQILARSLGATTEKLPQFINAGIELANSKDVMVYMHDSNTQTALTKLNWTGVINQNPPGDYLAVNDSNFAGGKSNLYVTENAELDIDTSGGREKHTLTLNYSNPQPYNIWLNAINRDYIRIYVPSGATLDSSNGSDAKVNTFDELGHTVFDAFIQIRPQNSRKLSFVYEVPAGTGAKELPLLIQKQPGTKDFHYIVKINGKTAQEFDLSSDKQFQLGL